MTQIAYQIALKNGDSHYYTGKPCKHGHLDKRFTSCKSCVVCVKEKYLARKQKMPDVYRKYGRDHYAANAEKISAKHRAYVSCNKDKILAGKKAYRDANPEKVAYEAALRRSTVQRKTPSWLTMDDLWIIKEVYALAKLRTEMTGFKWHVDHIIPLRGKTVSGLHVPTNLQVIPAKVNLKKGATYVA
jgi:hypothetical protein